MYTFIQKKLSFCFCLLVLLVTSRYNPAAAASGFSLKPIRPPGMRRFAQLLERAQRSLVLRRIDALINVTGFFNLIALASSPHVAVIPPVNGKPAARRSDTGAITTLSANLLLFPMPFFFNQAQRIDAFVTSARQLDPDIIFLQEVWDNSSMALLITAFPDYYSIYAPGIGYNYSGLLILSRFPVRKAVAGRFAVSLRHNAEELVAQKGYLLIETTICGQHFHLLNTHLYSAHPSRSFRPNLAQFSHIADIVSNLPGQVILGGDMNLLPADLAARLPAAIVRDSCNLPTAGYPKLSQKLDYILARPHVGKEVIISSRRIDAPLRFSDHNPVYAEITFR